MWPGVHLLAASRSSCECVCDSCCHHPCPSLCVSLCLWKVWRRRSQSTQCSLRHHQRYCAHVHKDTKTVSVINTHHSSCVAIKTDLRSASGALFSSIFPVTQSKLWLTGREILRVHFPCYSCIECASVYTRCRSALHEAHCVSLFWWDRNCCVTFVLLLHLLVTCPLT